MVWVFVAIGVFVFLGAAMYVPDWIRFFKWNRKQKHLPESKANKLRPPVAVPFWSSYAGGHYGGSGGSAGCASDCGPDIGGSGGGGFDVGGFDGGGDAGGCE